MEMTAIGNTASPLSSPVGWQISLYKGSLAGSLLTLHFRLDSSGAALCQLAAAEAGSQRQRAPPCHSSSSDSQFHL